MAFVLPGYSRFYGGTVIGRQMCVTTPDGRVCCEVPTVRPTYHPPFFTGPAFIVRPFPPFGFPGAPPPGP